MPIRVNKDEGLKTGSYVCTYAEFLTIILGPDLIMYCVIDPSLGWIQIPAKTDPE